MTSQHYAGDSSGISPVLRRGVLHLYGLHPEEVDWEPDELVVMCLVRDGMQYLGEFLDHYTSLGAKHLVFLDNDSTDGTLEALKARAESGGISVFSTNLPYREHRHEFKRYMLDEYGRRDRWVLVVDIDEFFDYPRSRSVGLRDFLTRLSRNRYTAVVSQMLDMFPEEPLRRDSDPSPDSSIFQGGGLRRSHRFYDITDIGLAGYEDHPWVTDNEVSNEDIMALRGGIRRQVFGVNPTLTKHPLMFLDDRVRPLEDSAHWSNGARVADISCVLYHYKFLQGFHEFVERAVQTESYADASSEYKAYLRVLRGTPELHLKKETGTESFGTDQLVASGFLTVSEEYERWADELEVARLTDLAKTSPAELVREYMTVRRAANIGGHEATRLIHERYEVGLEATRLRKKSRESTRRANRLEARLADFESSRLHLLVRYLKSLITRLSTRTRKDAS